jgi:hypothetical protein
MMEIVAEITMEVTMAVKAAIVEATMEGVMMEEIMVAMTNEIMTVVGMTEQRCTQVS